MEEMNPYEIVRSVVEAHKADDDNDWRSVGVARRHLESLLACHARMRDALREIGTPSSPGEGFRGTLLLDWWRHTACRRGEIARDALGVSAEELLRAAALTEAVRSVAGRPSGGDATVVAVETDEMQVLRDAAARAERDARRWEGVAVEAEQQRNLALAAKRLAEASAADAARRVTDQAAEMISGLDDLAGQIAARFDVPLPRRGPTVYVEDEH